MTGHPMFRTSASLFFLAAGYGQQVANDGIAAAQASCKQVELRLRLAETIRTPEASSTTGAPADDLRAASEACTRFKSALAAEDAAAARKAAVELLRLNPASAPVSPQERFVGEEAAAAGKSRQSGV